MRSRRRFSLAGLESLPEVPGFLERSADGTHWLSGIGTYGPMDRVHSRQDAEGIGPWGMGIDGRISRGPLDFDHAGEGQSGFCCRIEKGTRPGSFRA